MRKWKPSGIGRHVVLLSVIEIYAVPNAEVCLFIRYQNPDAWGLMGHLYYLTSRTEEAQDCYERTLAYTTEASDMHAIYLRLASIYLEKGEVGATLYYLSF